MPPESSVSLREFIELRFITLERELGNLRSAIEKLSVSLGTEQILLAGRVDKLESDMRVVRYVGGAIAFIILGLALAWAKSIFGI